MNIFDENLIKQVQNFSVELPDNDWEVLLAKMEAKKTKRIVLWRKYAVAASLTLLLGLSGLIRWYKSADNEQFVAKQVMPQTDNIHIPKQEKNNSESQPCKQQKIQFVTPNFCDNTEIQQIAETAIHEININNEQEIAQNNRQMPIEEAEKLLKPQNAENKDNNINSKKNKKQYYVSLLASASPAEIPLNIPDPVPFGIIRSYKGETIANNTYTDSQHDLPISFGFNVGIPIFEKLYVNTGLQYTLLHSEYSTFERAEAGNLLKSTDNQYLHYLGVPVMLSYRFFNNRIVKIYCSAGGVVEKGLFEQHRFKNTDRDALPQENTSEKIRGVQFSLNANIGASVRLFNSINLFVEPGAAWYIPAVKYIQPISSRTKNPLFVNLNAGLRFDIK
jgi:hypothetical protein